MKNKRFGTILEQLMHEIYTELVPILETEQFSREINYKLCTVKVLSDDYRTVWVVWGPYDCKLSDLPFTALGTVVDTVLREKDENR